MIVFNDIPNSIRTPFTYLEFDASKAGGGLPQFPTKLLVIGQRLATGTYPALVPQLITSSDQARIGFGAGSQLHHMIQRVRDNNAYTETYAIGVDDLAAGVKAAWTIDLTGTVPTESGLLALYIGGRRVQSRVKPGETADVVATNLLAAINLDADLPVTATRTGAVVSLTAVNAGEGGNEIDLRTAYFPGERLPGGIAILITQTVVGAGNPDLTTILAAIGGEHYEFLISPWTDPANMAVLDDWLLTVSGPTVMREAIAFTARRGTLAQLSTWGSTRNNQFVSCLGFNKSPSPAYEWAAAYGAVAAFHLPIDPARPIHTLALKGLLPPISGDRFRQDEQNILLYDGIATFMVSGDGRVQIQREITTYQKNAWGQQDAAWLDVQTPATLSFLRKDIRFLIESKFPRHKLADNGTRILAGQPIVTPDLLKDELIARALLWEALGLVENIDLFKREIVVERDAADRNRVNALIPTNLVNQFRVFAGQLQFII
ncbi:phage tail sheath subtilisin-like domain-containing protein [Elstera sp.]|jgi:phage tail sheath gpL-like|uniref:phage tail sheath subtilisin-like domain-containing protein n=1 Tax=Elstera sp. TaxID=1916664 RepID=UPI0037C051F4